MEDDKIVSLYWKRDELAITESRSKYGSQCRAIAYRILASVEDTDECENDTYLRAWNTMPPQRPKLLGAFLARIYRNTSLDLFKKHHAAKRGGNTINIVLEELSECIPDLTPNSLPSKSDENKKLAVIIDTFLEELPKETRIFFVQRYWLSNSIEEIAQKNNASQGKVKMSLFRTRKALKRKLEQEKAALQ